jgi:hypothetical protein
LLEHGRRDVGSEVEDRALWSRDRDAVVSPDLVAGQLSNSMDADAGAAALCTGHGDVNRTGIGWAGEQVPEGSGAAVTQHRAWATGEDSRHLAGMWRPDRPDKVDAAVEAPETPGTHSPFDRVLAETDPGQLLGAHNAMLAPDEGRESANSAARGRGQLPNGPEVRECVRS